MKIMFLLSTFDQPFFKDFLMPVGNLREKRSGYARASIIIITKCPPVLTSEMKISFLKDLKLLPKQKVFFARSVYGPLQRVGGTGSSTSARVILVSGLANSRPFEEKVRENHEIIRHFEFGDHHRFSQKDLNEISDFARKVGKEEVCKFITSEKDWMRLKDFEEALNFGEWWVLPMEMELDKEEELVEILRDFCKPKRIKLKK